MNELLDSRFPSLESYSSFLDAREGDVAERSAESSQRSRRERELREELVNQRQAALREALAAKRPVTSTEFSPRVQSGISEVLRLQQERDLLQYAIEQVTHLDEPATHAGSLRDALIKLENNKSDTAVELVATIRSRWYDNELSSRLADLKSVMDKTGWPKSDPPAGAEVNRVLKAVVELELPQTQSAVDVLAQPIAQRIKFHFQKDKDTARSDKPEWLFAYVTKIVDQRARWVNTELRNFVAEPIDRLLLALLPTLAEACRDNYDINTHFVSQLLKFSVDLESKYWCSTETTNTIIFGILSAENLEQYLLLEQKNHRELLDMLLKTGSQKIDFDADAPCAKPTFTAENLRQMLQQADYLIRLSPAFVLREVHLLMIRKYAEWLDNQMDVYDRSHSSLARAVGTSKEVLPKDTQDLEYLARIFGSSSYLKGALDMWSTEIDVLSIRDDVERLIDFFSELRAKVAVRMANLLARDIQKQLKPYFASDWHGHSAQGEIETSPTIKSAVEALSSSVSFIDRVCRTSKADRARVMVNFSDSLAKIFWRLVIQANTFTKSGAGQLRIDMEYLWSNLDLPKVGSFAQNIEATEFLETDSAHVPSLTHDQIDGLKHRRVASGNI